MRLQFFFSILFFLGHCSLELSFTQETVKTSFLSELLGLQWGMTIASTKEKLGEIYNIRVHDDTVCIYENRLYDFSAETILTFSKSSTLLKAVAVTLQEPDTLAFGTILRRVASVYGEPVSKETKEKTKLFMTFYATTRLWRTGKEVIELIDIVRAEKIIALALKIAPSLED